MKVRESEAPDQTATARERATHQDQADEGTDASKGPEPQKMKSDPLVANALEKNVSTYAGQPWPPKDQGHACGAIMATVEDAGDQDFSTPRNRAWSCPPSQQEPARTRPKSHVTPSRREEVAQTVSDPQALECVDRPSCDATKCLRKFGTSRTNRTPVFRSRSCERATRGKKPLRNVSIAMARIIAASYRSPCQGSSQTYS